MDMGVFSCLDGLSALIFPGFMTVLGHVPVLTTIISVSPKLAGISFSFQDDALTGFIILYRRPLPPFTVNKHIQCVRQCLGTMVLGVYVAVVHVNIHLSRSYFILVL